MFTITYRGQEKIIQDANLLEIYHATVKLGDQILINDVSAALFNHDAWNYKPTWERLMRAFKAATYNGTYQAFELEKYCEDRFYNN